MNPKNGYRWPVAALLFIAIVTMGSHAEPPSSVIPGEPESIPVMVARLQTRPMEEALEYVGDIKGLDEAMVYPKVSGKIADKVKQDGEAVKKGAVIAYVDRDEVGFQFEPSPVESPLSGVVGRVYVDRGASVTPQTPVALVVNLDKARLLLNVPEKALSQIALEQTAQIIVDAYDRSFTGRVIRISPVMDLHTRTAPVEILVDNPAHELKSGMFARARLVLERRENVLMILKESVLGMEPDHFVYVVKDGAAERRPVRLGLRRGPEYEVLEGLAEGDQVVILGQQRLTDGAKVTVEESATTP